MAAEQVRRWLLEGKRHVGGWSNQEIEDLVLVTDGPTILDRKVEPVLSASDAAWHVDRLRGDAPPGKFSNDAWHAALDAVVERLDLGEGN